MKTNRMPALENILLHGRSKRTKSGVPGMPLWLFNQAARLASFSNGTLSVKSAAKLLGAKPDPRVIAAERLAAQIESAEKEERANQITDDLLGRYRKLLSGFTSSQKLLIIQQLQKTPADKLNTVSESEWRKYQGAGDGFIAALIQKGMIGSLWDREKAAPLSPRQKAKQKKRQRIITLNGMIRRAAKRVRHQIKQWKAEKHQLLHG